MLGIILTGERKMPDKTEHPSCPVSFCDKPSLS